MSLVLLDSSLEIVILTLRNFMKLPVLRFWVFVMYYIILYGVSRPSLLRVYQTMLSSETHSEIFLGQLAVRFDAWFEQLLMIISNAVRDNLYWSHA